MPVINLKQLKIDEPTRNFDSSLDENINISAENNQGLFGAFKFFAGIRSFFKGISALGTLASGSRLPVTDSNGNVTYTTMNDINSYVINNALANLDKIKNNDTKTNANDCFSTTDGFSVYRLPSNATNTPEQNKALFIQSNTRWTNTTSAYITQFAFVVDTSAGTTEWRNAQSVYTRNGNNLNGVTTFSSWQKLTTETDLSHTDTLHTVGSGEGFNTTTFFNYGNRTVYKKDLNYTVVNINLHTKASFSANTDIEIFTLPSNYRKTNLSDILQINTITTTNHPITVLYKSSEGKFYVNSPSQIGANEYFRCQFVL